MEQEGHLKNHFKSEFFGKKMDLQILLMILCIKIFQLTRSKTSLLTILRDQKGGFKKGPMIMGPYPMNFGLDSRFV